MTASFQPALPTTASDRAGRGGRESRTSRLLKATVESMRLGKFDVVVRNISEHGIGGKTSRELARDDRVTVTLCNMAPIAGKVRWAWDGKFGIETDTPIPLAQLQIAHGSHLPSSDAYNGEFEIQRPMSGEARRPGLTIQRIGRGDTCKSDWITD